jgi:hypothetical protein
VKITVESNNDWLAVKKLAYRTIGKDTEIEPTSKWKSKMLRCQHSPIRSLVLTITMEDIPSWVSVHLVRHSIGVSHYVKTQRTDRTGVDRNELPQSNPVTHTMVVNAEAMINISRRRKCMQASMETRDVWQSVLWKVKEVEPELYDACVIDCIYRGFCGEYSPCGFQLTEEYKVQLEEYQKEIK